MRQNKKMNGTVRDGLVLLLLVIGFLLVLAFLLFVMPVIQSQKSLLIGEVGGTARDIGDVRDNGFGFQGKGELCLKIGKVGVL